MTFIKGITYNTLHQLLEVVSNLRISIFTPDIRYRLEYVIFCKIVSVKKKKKNLKSERNAEVAILHYDWGLNLN